MVIPLVQCDECGKTIILGEGCCSTPGLFTVDLTDNFQCAILIIGAIIIVGISLWGVYNTIIR